MFIFPETPSNDVVILGAGFSQALSDRMPSTDDLGIAVIRNIEDRSETAIHGAFRNGEFELWLSRLAEDQPDLSDIENLENRALFAQCSKEIGSVLNDCVSAAEGEALSQPWLQPFMGTLHARRATVVTFNQDTLIERAIGSMSLYSWNQRQWRLDRPQPRISWHDVLNDLPPMPTVRDQAAPQPSFRYLKLHGSTNWYWQPADITGSTVARWYLPGDVPFEEAHPDEEAARNRALPARVPFIVPPAASKSAFYRNPLTIQLWRDARHALQQGNVHVSLVGYSLPTTDVMTSNMIREALLSRRRPDEVAIEIVNPHPEPIQRNIEKLGLAVSDLTVTATVGSFVDNYQIGAAEELLAAMRMWQPEPEDLSRLVIVGTSMTDCLKVTAVTGGANSDELLLELEDLRPGETATNRPLREMAAPLTTGEILSHLASSRSMKIAARLPTGRRTWIVGSAYVETGHGMGDGTWQVLISAEVVRPVQE